MRPFDLEVWFGDRVAVLGSNGSGKSHLLRLLAAGGSDPDVEHRPVGARCGRMPVAHTGTARLGSRVRPGWFAQTHAHPRAASTARSWTSCTAATSTGAAPPRARRPRAGPLRAGPPAEQTFGSLSGGQQARFQILLLELSGATLLLLDEPTDNLDLESAEALESALDASRARSSRSPTTAGSPARFDRFLVFGADGTCA